MKKYIKKVIEFMKREKKGNLTISATLSRDFYDLAVENGLSWSDCLRKGISVSLSERSWGMSFSMKIADLCEKLSKLAQENYGFKAYVEGKAEKIADDLLKKSQEIPRKPEKFQEKEVF